jgi:GNAT superfamily N-acetyltransferase
MKARTPGLVVRPAEEDDALRLTEVERDSPVPGGRGISFTLDKGPDYLAMCRLQPEPVVLVAEIDDEVVGVHSASIHEGTLGGRLQRLAWLHYPRVRSEHRGKWIGRALQGELVALCRERVEASYQIMVSGDESEDGRRPWRTQPVWLLLDADLVDASPHGRPATAADAELIVEMLNAGHGPEALYRPHTVASLVERMERSPGDYSWDDLLIGDAAVVGLWRVGWGVVRNQHNRVLRSVQRNVLDYGFLPGAEGELLRLLRACCGQIESGLGNRYLGMWTSAGSPAFASLTALAGREFPFQLNVDAPEPPAASHRGVYLDALHG